MYDYMCIYLGEFWWYIQYIICVSAVYTLFSQVFSQIIKRNRPPKNILPDLGESGIYKKYIGHFSHQSPTGMLVEIYHSDRKNKILMFGYINRLVLFGFHSNSSGLMFLEQSNTFPF
jgi:hypothetical protein